MRVFVTGAGGMIGHATVARLLERGAEVVALVRSSSDISYAHYSLSWRLGDVRDRRLSEWVLGCDLVVHLAARKADESDSRAVNVEGTKNVVGAAKKCGIRGIVHVSSISTKFAHRGLYGETKLEADSIVRESAVPHVILRPSVVYADLKSGTFGSLARYMRLPFVPVVGAGEATTQPIFVEDVAEAIAQVVSDSIPPSATYDIGGPDLMTLNELILTVGWHLYKRSVRILHIPLAVGFLIAKALSFLPHPPISRSNIIGMNEEASVDIAHFCAAYNFVPRSIDSGLKTIEKRKSERESEARSIMRYVYGRDVSDFYVELYDRALKRHGLEPHSLSNQIWRSTLYLGALDTVTKFMDRDGIFRKKLAVASALYEASPLSAEMLLPRGRSIISIFASFAYISLAWIFKLALGAVLLLVPKKIYA